MMFSQTWITFFNRFITSLFISVLMKKVHLISHQKHQHSYSIETSDVYLILIAGSYNLEARSIKLHIDIVVDTQVYSHQRNIYIRVGTGVLDIQ